VAEPVGGTEARADAGAYGVAAADMTDVSGVVLTGQTHGWLDSVTTLDDRNLGRYASPAVTLFAESRKSCFAQQVETSSGRGLWGATALVAARTRWGDVGRPCFFKVQGRRSPTNPAPPSTTKFTIFSFAPSDPLYSTFSPSPLFQSLPRTPLIRNHGQGRPKGRPHCHRRLGCCD
jgi:hypothetical protein